jgi:2-haloacid dehalogenase
MATSTSGFEPGQVSVVTFDSYGTLVDTGSAARVLEDIVDDPDSVARAWRQNALTYSLVANQIDEYRTYVQLHLDGLRDALADAGVDLPESRLEELNEVYYRLDPFEDTREGVRRLDEAGYRPSIVSNGNPEMLDALVESADIGDHVHELASADDVTTLKPAARLYERAADRLDVAVDEVAHVTAHWMDVQGAAHAGMQGVWLAREGTSFASFDGDPDLTVESMADLCDSLDA